MAKAQNELHADVVRTRRLVLEDESGTTAAFVSVEPRAGERDVPYFRIGTGEDAAFFEIAMQADRAPTLRFNDKHGRTRILMEVTDDDIAGLTVLDANGTARARLVVAADGRPTMMLDQGARIIRQRFDPEPS